MIGAIDTSWAVPGNYTQLLTHAMSVYFEFIPRDIFIALIITVIAFGIFLSSDGSLKLTFSWLLLADFFFATILYSGVIAIYGIVCALMGGYIFYKTYYG